jgi:hypothetical protein
MQIVKLKTIKDECNQEVIDKLEEALDDARNGDITAIGLALVHRDNSISIDHSGAERAGLLLGACAHLLHRINIVTDQVIDANTKKSD